MTTWDLASAAYAADPIACWVAIVAALVVFAAALVRRGFIDARFIIDVFSIFATVGTLLKVILWMARTMTGDAATSAPGGTDLVLVAGGLFAILFVSLQALVASFPGDAKDRSLLQTGYAAVSASVVPTSIRKALGVDGGTSAGNVAKETDEAKREREQKDREGRG